MEAKAEPSAGGLRKKRDMEKLYAFFDVETTVPSLPGIRYFLLEFGAILVCPRRLVEVEVFSTLIRPSDLNAISPFSIHCNGITRDSVATSPSFVDVADKVYSILHGRVWAGHNILEFDCVRIREAFAELGRSPPEPMGTIDTLPLLTKKFGRRAGNMKMATLAYYFGLKPQKHRSLDDVRLNLEVLKHCATVLFLESENIIAKNCNNQNEILVIDDTVCSTSQAENFVLDFTDATSYNDSIKKLNSCDDSLVPNDVLLQFITIGHLNSSTMKKMQIFHFDVPLWLYCPDLVIHFGITKFTDRAGRPELSILVNAPDHLCHFLRVCESLVQNSLRSYGSTSEWNSSTVHLTGSIKASWVCRKETEGPLFQPVQ